MRYSSRYCITWGRGVGLRSVYHLNERFHESLRSTTAIVNRVESLDLDVIRIVDNPQVEKRGQIEILMVVRALESR